MAMFALTDVSGCYASFEKVFDPSIRKRPVIVLSNNDAQIIAVCPVAKALNIPKFVPYHQVKFLLQHHNVAVYSSNYELYQNISDNMISVISQFSDDTYQYSIDEAFSKFNNYDNLIDDWEAFGHSMRRKIWKFTKVPVGIGIAPTIVLSKVANHASKKLKDSTGVAVIQDEHSRIETLNKLNTNDVWGIGSKLTKKLGLLGIHSAYQLSTASPKAMRQQFGVNVERIVEELNGVNCIAWDADDLLTQKKQIYSTRSLGQRITNAFDLRKALTTHAIKVCNKARAQKSLIKTLYIFASNSPYDKHHFKRSLSYEFTYATDNVSVISGAIDQVIKGLFKEGVLYYKCGVGAVEMVNSRFEQSDIFAPKYDAKTTECYYHINQRFGKGTLRLASESHEEKWAMKRQFLSKRYTTRWSDIPLIKC